MYVTRIKICIDLEHVPFFPMNECNLCLFFFFFKIILYVIKYCHAPSSTNMNWACDNSHKPIDTVPVSSILRKYTIPAIKPVLLQNVPKKTGYIDLF